MFFTISLDFKSTLSDPAKAAFARNILTRLKGNVNFPSVQSLIETELQAVTERFEKALQEAADRSRSKIAQKNEISKEVDDVLEKTAFAVSTDAKGNRALILESGFLPRTTARRPTLTGIEQVTGVQARPGLQPGEVIVEYQPVTGAKMYGIESSLDNAVTWQNGTYSNIRRASVTGLPIRQDILFRVYAIGAKQMVGAMSDVARVFLV